MPPETPAASATPRKTWRQLSRPARMCVLATYVLVLLLGLEVACRVFWVMAKKVPFFGTDQIFHAYFPQWKSSGVDQAPRERDDDVCDVLVLGPSVWHSSFGDLAPRFGRSLEKTLGKKVRVFNLSYPGHTSRDALLAYRHLSERRFDLVVVYHSINDQYMNNIPAERYHHNYTHASRFEQLALLTKHPEHSWFVLPLTLRSVKSKIWDSLHLSTQPDMQFSHLAVEPKTGPAFRSNMEKMLALARQRGDKMLFMTFATYIPAENSEKYTTHVDNMKGWGTPESVRRCTEVHNDILRDIARTNPDVFFSDMAAHMPAGERTFTDCCHLTAEGCAVFIDRLIPSVDWQRLR